MSALIKWLHYPMRKLLGIRLKWIFLKLCFRVGFLIHIRYYSFFILNLSNKIIEIVKKY
jgi:hypothetical protein